MRKRREGGTHRAFGSQGWEAKLLPVSLVVW